MKNIPWFFIDLLGLPNLLMFIVEKPGDYLIIGECWDINNNSAI